MPDPRRQLPKTRRPREPETYAQVERRNNRDELVTYKAELTRTQPREPVTGSTHPKGSVTPGRSKEGGSTTAPLKGNVPRTKGRARDWALRTTTKRRQRSPKAPNVGRKGGRAEGGNSAATHPKGRLKGPNSTPIGTRDQEETVRPKGLGGARSRKG